MYMFICLHVFKNAHNVVFSYVVLWIRSYSRCHQDFYPCFSIKVSAFTVGFLIYLEMCFVCSVNWVFSFFFSF